jgi:hypothetical protein
MFESTDMLFETSHLSKHVSGIEKYAMFLAHFSVNPTNLR